MDGIASNTSEEQQDMSQEPAAFDGGTQCNDESKTENQVKEYPAAELIANTCKEEYMRLINTYTITNDNNRIAHDNTMSFFLYTKCCITEEIVKATIKTMAKGPFNPVATAPKIKRLT